MFELTFGSGSHIRKIINIVKAVEENNSNPPPIVDDAVTDNTTLTD